jgi:uncharacterized protein YlaN (UPF0358 family)
MFLDAVPHMCRVGGIIESKAQNAILKHDAVEIIRVVQVSRNGIRLERKPQGDEVIRTKELNLLPDFAHFDILSREGVNVQ